MQIEPIIPLIDEILGQYRADIGGDFAGYRNHVYRVVHFCLALHACDADARRKILIAACFHDIGIWTDHTVDYLQPSGEHAGAYLREGDESGLHTENGMGAPTPRRQAVHGVRAFR